MSSLWIGMVTGNSMPLKMMSRLNTVSASYLIGVYSNRNLCFVAGRRTTLNCVNQAFSMPSSSTESMSLPMMPSIDSLLITIAGVGFQKTREDLDMVVFASRPADVWAAAGPAAPSNARVHTHTSALRVGMKRVSPRMDLSA